MNKSKLRNMNFNILVKYAINKYDNSLNKVIKIII